MKPVAESVSFTREYGTLALTYADLRRLLRMIEAQFAHLIPAHVEQETAFSSQHLDTRKELLAQAEERASRIAARGDQRIVAATSDADNAKAAATELGVERSRVVIDGENEHLRRLAAAVAEEKAEAQAYATEMRELVKDADEVLADKTRTARLAGRINLEMRVSRSERRTTTGTYEELLEYVDGKKFTTLELFAPSGSIRGYSIAVTANRGDGTTLRVSAHDDPRWATTAFRELSREFDQLRPWWRALRSVWFLGPFYWVTSAIALTSLTEGVQRLAGSDVGLPSEGSVGLGIVLTILATFATMLTQRAVPAFELTRDEAANRGRGIVKAVGSAVAAVAVGLLTNYLSQLLSGS